jgi:hypothetical protein
VHVLAQLDLEELREPAPGGGPVRVGFRPSEVTTLMRLPVT